MSTSKADPFNIFRPVTFQGNQTRLALPQDAVRVRRNGVEFRSPEPIPVWAEMTVTLQTPFEGRRFSCTGVVVACEGNRHQGYAVSMLFLNLSRQSRDRLSALVPPRSA